MQCACAIVLLERVPWLYLVHVKGCAKNNRCYVYIKLCYEKHVS